MSAAQIVPAATAGTLFRNRRDFSFCGATWGEPKRDLAIEHQRLAATHPGPLVRSAWPPGSLCGLAISALATSSGCSSMASQAANVEGVRLYQQGNYQQASDRFQQAIAQDPTSPEGYYNLAASLHKTGTLYNRPADLQQAEVLYNQCLERDPNHADAHRGLAVLLNETNRQPEAFRLLNSWAAANPKSPEPKIELARLLEETGQTEQAKTQLVDALTIDPHNARGAHGAGPAARSIGQLCPGAVQLPAFARGESLPAGSGRPRRPTCRPPPIQWSPRRRSPRPIRGPPAAGRRPCGTRLRDLATATPDITSIIARQNSGRSSGLRLLTKWRSTTTAASSQIAPAFTRSSLMPANR